MPETATDPLILAAEQADAEAAAAEAEALAAQASATAARARARAAKLRREAGEHRRVAADAESAAAGSAAVPADSGASVPAPPASTPNTDAVGESGAVADDSARGGTAATSGTEAASSGAKTALLPGSPDSEATATQVEAASSATPERDTAASSGPHADTPEGAGSDSDTATGSEASGESSTRADSGSGTSAGSRPIGGVSKGSDTAAVTKNRTAEGVGKVAERFAAAGRRMKPGTVRRPRGRMVARALVAVIVLLSLATGGYSIWNHQQIAAAQAREDEFLNAAREGVIALTTLDSGRATDDVKRVLDHSTGAFRTDFQTRSEDFTKVVEQSKVATQGEITAAAVESMTDESAVVLVSAVSRVTNSAGAQQEPRVWRLSVTVTREGAESKMSKVEFVP
ncbi:hypothetical protein [Nocardia flavorosea]|uniref:Mce-associated membrane protein n=1 Tax=Nocardia flavorosea TaxID=53429 RepID=A0A846YJ76_9NOCA|nr:hypothetical protein [Nocardia flavorosea]NKY57710.1 hypothetical protein [Nocardia flavorosea]